VADPVNWGAGYERPRVDYSGVRPHPADEVVERLAWLMDNSIPLPGGWRIGLDPLIGLIPGVGDLVGTLVSTAIVYQAHRAGLPRATVLRMVANVGIDAAVGAIPFLGDAFDFAFKANTKNLQLYRQARAGLHKTQHDVWFLAGILLALGLAVAIPLLILFWAIQAIAPRLY
jgi:hypothetical protein